MPKKDNRMMPTGYAVCVHADCTQGEHCLRRKVYNDLTPTTERLTVINPERCTKSADCPYFRDSAPVNYARGFKGMRLSMNPVQYSVFQETLRNTYSRTYYYALRRGDFGLSPRDQEIVRNALRQAGVSEELDFDAYESQYDWED